MKSAEDNKLCQKSFERIIGFFGTLSFQDYNLLIVMNKLEPEKAAPTRSFKPKKN